MIIYNDFQIKITLFYSNIFHKIPRIYLYKLRSNLPRIIISDRCLIKLKVECRMLVNTFLHLPNVGYIKEQKLWKCGIIDWNKFLESADAESLPNWINPEHLNTVETSMMYLNHKDYSYFAENIPRKELWRTFPEFKETTVYLDIETTGLDFYDNEITIVGLYDGKSVKTLILDSNLNELPKLLNRYSTIVSFNGIQFDIPFIEAKFPDIELNQIQLDLRFILKRLGLRGGLKRIERQLSISRASETSGLTGFDAIRLWRQYERGNKQALKLLIEYNTEDIVNLEYLMNFAYSQLKSNTFSDFQ